MLESVETVIAVLGFVGQVLYVAYKIGQVQSKIDNLPKEISLKFENKLMAEIREIETKQDRRFDEMMTKLTEHNTEIKAIKKHVGL